MVSPYSFSSFSCSVSENSAFGDSHRERPFTFVCKSPCQDCQDWYIGVFLLACVRICNSSKSTHCQGSTAQIISLVFITLQSGYLCIHMGVSVMHIYA